MKIWTLWEWDSDPLTLPWLVSAYDEITFDNIGGEPDDYKRLREEDPKRKELVIDISTGAVEALFKPKEIEGSVWVSKEAAEQAKKQFDEDKKRGK